MAYKLKAHRPGAEFNVEKKKYVADKGGLIEIAEDDADHKAILLRLGASELTAEELVAAGGHGKQTPKGAAPTPTPTPEPTKQPGT